MKKKFPSMAKQLEILGFQLLTLGFCAQPAICAGPVYIPGYYGNAASILPPAANALPSGATVINGINGIDTAGSAMTVHQGKPRAVIHWQDFNIGSEASVYFDQQDSSWKVLNRVMGNSHSQIYGSLTAKGQVYILNQNGILFGPGSQVNVHSLTASALNLDVDDMDFLDSTRPNYLTDFSQGGKEIYTYAPYNSDATIAYPRDATVANHGTITAGDLGSVFLIGPQVENNGTITARGGDVGLFAGDRIEISQYDPEALKDTIFDPVVTGGNTLGTVTNFADGKIITEKGCSGMYGSVVNQEGLIRAVTALEKNGRIVLQGTNRVTLGKDSNTEVLVSDSGERKVVDADTFKKSSIEIRADKGTIEHYGRISAPGGEVSLTARDRVLLEAGSSIDVAGSWVELTVKDRTVEVQLNSEELRDAFVYKDGPLKGQKVQVDTVTGLSLADISGYLDSMEKSAPEMTTKGGKIELKATGDNGEVIVKEDASQDFSGGGLIYADGLIAATKVRVGNKIYALQDVPAGVPIDEVLGSFSKEYTRYGKIDKWQGIWYGGSSSYLSYLPSFIQGADGGILSIIARKVILDGAMNASVVRGIYQNALEDPTDENGNLTAVGRRVPRAGTLQVGNSVYDKTLTNNDLKTDAIVIKEEVASTTVSGDESLPDQNDAIRTSELSAAKINAAGLGSLKLYANTEIKVEKDVTLNLAELGAVDFVAQNIEHEGSIRIPSGTVDFTILGIVGSKIPNVKDRIFLADDSSIDVSGQQLDNSATGFGSPLQFGFTHGGTVNLLDENQNIPNGETPDDGEVILAGNSHINVNGGYTINGDQSITGGNAGSLTIKGNGVALDGDLVGLALEGSEGGTLSIHADEVTVATSAPSLPDGFNGEDELPENLQHHLILADNRFVNTGFSHITLKSEGDLRVEKGVSLAPSAARLTEPLLTTTGYRLEESATVTARPEYFGPSSLTLAAGQKALGTSFQGTVIIEEGASLSVAPDDGKITLQGDAVTLAGSLTARGGDIKGTAKNGSVKLASTARIDASGTSLPDLETSLPRQPLNNSVVDGGSVDLSASADVVLAAGSRIDVSGSEAVTNRTVDQNGDIFETTTASAAGSVSIEYQNDFTSDGELLGRSSFSWLPGGSFAVSKTRMNSDAEGHTTTLTVQEDTITELQKNGFDDFTFSSRREIDFAESALDNDEDVIIAVNRGLTLNSSTLVGSSGQNIDLSASWLQLTNIKPGTTSDSGQGERTFGTLKKLSEDSANLALNGDFIDIQGNIALSGFATTTVHAANDLRLYDYYYKIPQQGWSGALRTAGDLTLQAAAIYPGMHHSMSSEDNTHTIYPSSFTITAGPTAADGSIKPGEGGTITILAPEQPSHQDIYSAGGKLTLLAGNIEHHGVLAAPMGEIVLTAENSIVLDEGSILSTRGEAMTLYGKLKDEQWTVGGYNDNSTPAPYIPVTADPEKSVRITAEVITQAPDAVIDVSGGGSIFAYEFLPGYDGSSNPLEKEGRYVILPDNSVILPGKTVYLEGTAGLESGTYSLLPVEYAFLPGAVIIEDTGKTVLTGTQTITPTGYTMIAGTLGDRSISEPSPFRSGFIIRDAREVMQTEGKFDTRQAVAGNAGLLEISGSSTTLAGPLLAAAMAGYDGGSLRLSGENIFLGLGGLLLDEDWWHSLSLETELPVEYTDNLKNNTNRLVLDTSKIQTSGLRSLQLGDSNTENIFLTTGSTLDGIAQVEMVTAKETGNIILQSGAQVHARDNASDNQGTLTLTANTLYGEDNTLLRASDALTFNVDNLNSYTFAGDVQVDHGVLQVNSNVIFLEPADYTGAQKKDPGFHLIPSLVDAFKSIDQVVLTSRSDMIALGNVNLAAKGDLTLDSTRFTVDNSETTDPEWGFPMVYPYTVNISAGGMLCLQNSNDKSTQDRPFNGNTINLTAATIAFGPGDLNFDTFEDVHFTSSGETVFNGTGSLNADLTESGALTFNASRYLSVLTPKSTINVDGSEFLSFELSDFTIDGGLGDIVMAGNGTGGTSTLALPGSLTVKGENIKLADAIFNMPGGVIDFQAGQDIIVENSSILAAGEYLDFPVTVDGVTYDNTVSLAGGQVAMRSSAGRISIDGSTTIDTSAETGLEGGDIILSAPENGVTIANTATLKGDRIALDTNAIDDFGVLSRIIAGDGHSRNFSKLVDLRARTGDVNIKYADVVKTDHFILSTDQGGVDIWGTIDASAQEKGGVVEIFAHDDLTLESTARILAKGEGETGEGGSVVLASTEGAVQTIGLSPEYGGGSLIDVSGNNEGGSVTFRASRDVIGGKALDSTGNKIEMRLDGEIRGASERSVHAFRIYEDDEVTVEDVQGYTDTNTGLHVDGYMDHLRQEWSSLENSWKEKYPAIELIPEIEVRSSGDLTLSSGLNNLNFLTTGMPNGKPGIFTFKAAEDLKVTSNIIDAPKESLVFNTMKFRNEYVPVADGKRDSWALNFVGGADLASSRLLTVREGRGNFTVGTEGAGKLIYTESGNINFAAGNDVTIHAYPTKNLYYMPGTDNYNLASFDGAISGYAGGDLVLKGGVIQTAVSDIHLQVRNNVDISLRGAIRTTGRAPLLTEIPEFNNVPKDLWYIDYLAAAALERFWDYRNGGNISLAAGGDVTGTVAQPDGMGWDYAYKDNLTGALIKLKNAYEDMKAAETAGDLEKTAELKKVYEDMVAADLDQTLEFDKPEKYGAAYGMEAGFEFNGSKSGQTTHGIATMAGGGIAIKAENIYSQIGAFGDGDLTVYARGDLDGRFMAANGDIHLTALADFGNTADNVNREDTLVELGSGSLAIQALGNVSLGTISSPTFVTLPSTWQLSYDEQSSVTINSALGDTVVSGKQDFPHTGISYQFNLLPASLDVTAARDIRLGNAKPFILAPSADGHLSLVAGRDINGKYKLDTGGYDNANIFMSAADPAAVYGNKGTGLTDDLQGYLLKFSNTVPKPLHIDNSTPVAIKAGRDIANLSLSLTKKAEISAGRDIREIGYWGQNLRDEDVSLISAGRNLIQKPYDLFLGNLGINQAGHGFLLVRAGGSIDLGSSGGIQSTGSSIGSSGGTQSTGSDSGVSFENSALFDSEDRDEFNRYNGADVTVISGYTFIPKSSEELTEISSAIIESGEKKIEEEKNGQNRSEIIAEIREETELLKGYIALLLEYNNQLEKFKTTGKSEDENKADQIFKSVSVAFFEALTRNGEKYADQQGIFNESGKPEDQDALAGIKKEMIEFIINPLLQGNTSTNGSGDIAMTQSTIKTTSGQDDLYILAAGQIDVGTSIIGSDKKTSKGLLTEGGGSINVFAEKDINVNESRVVTYFGGDILLLSNEGDINAGRGSKTAVSPMAAGSIDVGSKLVDKFSAPAPGSGIRTLSADPDGAGPLKDPGILYTPAGDIVHTQTGDVIHTQIASLIAWNGIIDAGEAGISSGNLRLAATKVLNANNISFSDSGVGVPVTAEAGPSLGALAGASTVSESQTTSQSMGQQVIANDKTLAASMNKISESLNIKMLVFKLEGFSDELLLKPEQNNSDSRGNVDETI